MEDAGLIARDVALLQKAQGIGAQPSYLIIFALAAIMSVCAIVGVLAGGIVGIVIFVVIAIIGAIARFTPVGDNLIIAVVVIASLIVGVTAVAGAGYSLTGGGHVAAPAAAPASE
ncbi:MAG: hypothetical protein JRH11_11575 [Deltaproteobacteria bacterium]|nr:hypothetical protein [Deltaproteobacteria bacterium]